MKRNEDIGMMQSINSAPATARRLKAGRRYRVKAGLGERHQIDLSICLIGRTIENVLVGHCDRRAPQPSQGLTGSRLANVKFA